MRPSVGVARAVRAGRAATRESLPRGHLPRRVCVEQGAVYNLYAERVALREEAQLGAAEQDHLRPAP